MDLTYKQRLFVDHYLGAANGNGTKAAQMAGYGSVNVAAVAASRLLRNAKIQVLIAEKTSASSIPANEVLARLSEFGTADIGNYLTIHEDGSFEINLSKARKCRRTRAIKKVKVTKRTMTTKAGTEVEIKSEFELHSPFAALEKLFQFHGLQDAKVAQLARQVEDLEKRVGEGGPAS